jgi:hypothetical protein
MENGTHVIILQTMYSDIILSKIYRNLKLGLPGEGG